MSMPSPGPDALLATYRATKASSLFCVCFKHAESFNLNIISTSLAEAASERDLKNQDT